LLSLEERQIRGVAAEQLLSNELLQEAFGSLEADLLKQMYAVRLDDKESHSRLILALQTGRAVVKFLGNTIHDGQTAGNELELRGRRLD
jgi:hypothetical protein